LLSQIDMETGDKYYQKMTFEEMNGERKLVAGEWGSSGVKQRAHTVREENGGLYVDFATEPPRCVSSTIECLEQN